MFKEVTILGYLYDPITELSAPADEVLFILNANLSSRVGGGGRKYFPFHESLQL